jgi:hypothetical protein
VLIEITTNRNNPIYKLAQPVLTRQDVAYTTDDIWLMRRRLTTEKSLNEE